MTDKEIISLLRKPDIKPVQELIIEMANLTVKEESAIRLCVVKDYTQFEAAEKISRSEDAVQRWYRAGMKKLHAVCDKSWWINKISE